MEFDGLGNVPQRFVAKAQVPELVGLAFEAVKLLVHREGVLEEFDGLGNVPQRLVAEAQVPEVAGLAF